MKDYDLITDIEKTGEYLEEFYEETTEIEMESIRIKTVNEIFDFWKKESEERQKEEEDEETEDLDSLFKAIDAGVNFRPTIEFYLKYWAIEI